MATGAEIAGYLALKAAESFVTKVGENVADEFTEWLFGEDDELDVIEQKLEELQRQLTVIDNKLNKIIDITRQTLALVQDLPSVIGVILDEQERDRAYRNLDSDITVFRNLSGWDGMVGSDAIREGFQNWRAFLALETRVESLLLLPKYGEFLRIISKGDLAPAISSDIKTKLPVLNGLLKFEIEKQIAVLVSEGQGFRESGLIQDLRTVYQAPWVSWRRAEDRTHLETIDRCTHIGYHDPDRCHTYEIRPDTYWNRRVKKADERMAVISSEIGKSFAIVQTLQAIIITLEQYVSFLDRQHPSQTALGVVEARVRNQDGKRALFEG